MKSAWDLVGPAGAQSFRDGDEELAQRRVYVAYERASSRFDRDYQRAEKADEVLAQHTRKKPELVSDKGENMAPTTTAKQDVLLEALRAFTKREERNPSTTELGKEAGLKAPNDAALNAQVAWALKDIRGTLVDWARGKGVFLIGEGGGASKSKAAPAPKSAPRLKVASIDRADVSVPSVTSTFTLGSIEHVLSSRRAELVAEIERIDRMLSVA